MARSLRTAMAYKDVILGDGPVVYYEFTEASGAFANSGSAGGTTSTVGSGVTRTSPGAGTTGGSAVTAPSVAANGAITLPNRALTAGFSIEMWIKSNTLTTGTQTLFTHSATNNNVISISNAGYFRYTDGTVNDGIVDSNLVNGQWHHLVVTKTSTGAVKQYIDGTMVKELSGNAATRASAALTLFTSTTNSSRNFSMDEFAVYEYVLTDAQALYHYQSGVATATPVTVSAPPSVLTIPVRTPVLHVGRRVPAGNAAALSLASVAPKNNNIRVQAPSAMLSLSAPAPVITGIDNRVVTTGAILDKGTFGSGTTEVISLSDSTNANAIYMRFALPPLASDYKIDSVVMKLVGLNSSGADQQVRFALITSDWVETDNVAPSRGTLSTQTYTLSKTGTSVFDVTDIAQNWRNSPNYGIAILNASSGNGTVVGSRENSTPANRPSMTTTVSQVQGTPATIQAPPSVMSLATATPQVKLPKRVAAPASVISLSAPAPVVRVSRSVIIPTTGVTLTLQSPGGQPKNPDSLQQATAINAYVFTPNPNVIGGSDSKISVPAAVMNLQTVAATVDLKTDKTVYVTNPSTLSLRAIGIYSKEDDRYINYVKTTVESDDIWYQMEETMGTLASDFTGPDYSSGTYLGGPVFQVEGPELRKAVRFDGVDDSITVGTYPQSSLFTSMDATIEFSIRTTQLNGTITSGASSQIKLVNGELVLVETNGTQSRVRKNIADGQWHHVVISMPTVNRGSNNEPIYSSSRPYFVMIDGISEYVRYVSGWNGRAFLPQTVMAGVAGDMRDLIVRSNYAVSLNTAAKLYYEWSNTLVIQAPPATMTFAAQAAKPVGNVKKMLAIYGLPWADGTSQPFGNYLSIFGGYLIKNTDGAVSRAFNGYYAPVQPFYLDKYLVYPVSIDGQAPSADGVQSEEYTEPSLSGIYIDDRTGLPRFIDLDKDLVGTVGEYDTITVVNYPNANLNSSVAGDQSLDLKQGGIGLTQTEWSRARDALRDTILKASRSGVNLWVPEIHMAEHLGLIGAWDKHTTGQFPITQGRNVAGRELDLAHGVSNAGTDPTRFYYETHWQTNIFRRIVATEPGLTDIPSWDYKQGVMRVAFDLFTVHSQAYAHDLNDYTSGLKIGDRTKMSIALPDPWEQPPPYYRSDGRTLGFPRKYVVSARAAGVVGKIIATEQATYFGPNGTIVQNRFASNATTIIAERGTVVRGAPIGGRIFMEFMDTDINRTYIERDFEKTGSTWDYDSRRGISLPGGTEEVSYDPMPTEKLPYVSMAVRGLRWLAAAESLPAGAVKVYSPSVELNLRTPNVNIARTRNLVIEAEPAMLDLEFVRPRNVFEPDVTVRARPVILSLKVNGLGKTIKASPAELDLDTPNSNVNAGGDRIEVYLDTVRLVRVFLKEE